MSGKRIFLTLIKKYEIIQEVDEKKIKKTDIACTTGHLEVNAFLNSKNGRTRESNAEGWSQYKGKKCDWHNAHKSRTGYVGVVQPTKSATRAYKRTDDAELILRCRQDARARFARLRSDVLVKIELLDNKHVQDIVWQLQRFVSGLVEFHRETYQLLKGNSLFPIEVDLSRSAFQYKSTSPVVQSRQRHSSLFRCILEARVGGDYMEKSATKFLRKLLWKGRKLGFLSYSTNFWWNKRGQVHVGTRKGGGGEWRRAGTRARGQGTELKKMASSQVRKGDKEKKKERKEEEKIAQEESRSLVTLKKLKEAEEFVRSRYNKDGWIKQADLIIDKMAELIFTAPHQEGKINKLKEENNRLSIVLIDRTPSSSDLNTVGYLSGRAVEIRSVWQSFEYLFCSSLFATNRTSASGTLFTTDLIPASGSLFATNLYKAWFQG
uniref:AH domain-containing protein n=1 Tax=Timema tahoe TaxID=61484 RepID=A0A7R9IRF1_9NEOP|nr:unnamed protein product [Timema tahoe]